MRAFLLLGVGMFALLASLEVMAKNCKTEAACFEPRITWRFDRSGQIVDVCHNYGYGHWKYRKCMMEAQKLFKQRCQDAKYGERNTQGRYREDHSKQAALYCSRY